MKIYRYIPNAKDYSAVAKSAYGQWWPDGLEVNPLWPELFPKPEPWLNEGNRYLRIAEHGILPDFPAFSLGLPLVSERAMTALADLIEAAVPITVSGEPFYAISPVRSEAFEPDASQGLQLPGGDTFCYTHRSFNTEEIRGEFFTLPPYEPFSDLYLTDRLVEIVLRQRLTGLEYIELVYDDGPVEAVYPAIARANIPEFTMRRSLEYELIYRRCSLWCYAEDDIQKAVYDAVAAGVISFDYVQPEYRRGSRINAAS